MISLVLFNYAHSHFFDRVKRVTRAQAKKVVKQARTRGRSFGGSDTRERETSPRAALLLALPFYPRRATISVMSQPCLSHLNHKPYSF